MKKFSMWRVATALAALFVSALPATAQVTGAIRVVVVDADGGALPGVTVSAEAEDVLVKRSGTTGQNGETLLPALDPSNKYVVTSTLAGFNGARNENVLVTSGQTATVRVTLQLADVTEEVTVIAETPLVDVTSAVTGQDLTLEMTEALPTRRSYQSYLQLVPGVMPDVSSTNRNGSGNPASRSGLNYSDIPDAAGVTIGASADNFYYIEGINVTDPVTGTFGANLNTEIIQEQKVVTGGIPAEFVGAPGLVSSVITKTGGSSFSGSVRYDTEDESLQSDNENIANADFERTDIAATIGGPVVSGDKAWFFASYREIESHDDINTLDTNLFLRTVERNDEQAFAKLSWAITGSQNLAGTYMSDPTDISGSNSRTVVANRDRPVEQGGDRFILNYTGIFGPAVVSLAGGKHNGEVSQFVKDTTNLNGVIFRRTDGSTLAQQQLGGAGSILINERDTEFYKGDLEWYLSTGAGDHTIKFGADFQDHINFRDTTFTGPQFRGSLNPGTLGGISAADLSALAAAGQLTNSFFNPNNASDVNGFLATVNASPNRNSFYAAFDTNHDGTITGAELGAALRYTSTAGNPHGKINYDRVIQVSSGSQETRSEGTSFYLQDSFRLGNFTFNVGARAEEWAHVATTGEEIFTFDYEVAPRVSGAWDINGDGRQKLSAYYGRYFDPIRNNLTNFAGTLSGTVTNEQVFANGEWVTYRVRGGPVVLDATFAPTTKTPYTDEILASYQRDLGSNMAVELSVYHRETEDIIEDYDLCLYAGECYTGDPNAAGSLFIGPQYFGFDQIPGGINFFIATLKGGKRELDGAELIFRKRLSNNWQGGVSYTYTDATGNNNSDSNADFAGDVLFLDPRAVNIESTQSGSIENLIKLHGSYHFDFGLVMGGLYRWNSGVYTTRAFRAFGRNLPVAGDTSVRGGAVDTFAGWAQPNSVGGVKNPSYGVLDLSASYEHKFGPVGAEFFLSVFNATDDQDAILTESLQSGTGSTQFGDPILWVGPRAITLGARLSFGR